MKTFTSPLAVVILRGKPTVTQLAPCGHYVATHKGKEFHYPPDGGLSVPCVTKS